ncbi:MAG: hypothetical protein ABIK09_17880 [Pseudomonadota bacterium]
MIALELTCLGIVALYLGVKNRRGAEPPRALLGRLAVVAAAAWITEETCIRLYGFYGYGSGWSVFVGSVPLLVVLIWPVVIDSARDLASRLTGPGPLRLAGITAALVLADAALIEPVSVHAGLWSWTAPGLFGVPPVGVLGWSFFTLACVGILQVVEGRRWGLRGALLAIPGALALTHILLLAAWWGALRWVSVEVAPWPAVAGAGLLSLALTLVALRAPGCRVPPKSVLLQRVPAAAFFFVLLVIHREGAGALVAWTLCFAPPYLVLTARASSR